MAALRVAISCACGVVLLSPFAGEAIGVAQQQPRTTSDGVFTLEQAERGKAKYETACGYCHMDDLSGGGGDEPGSSPPALIGSEFLSDWRDATLAELVGTVAATMPFERPKLEPQAYVDIVSYLLQANGMPAGDTALPLQAEALRQIVIVPRQSGD